MKMAFKKISALTLAAVFFISAILCCCLIQPAQAKESNVPACHKTAQSQKASHDAQDCDCCKSKIQADHSIPTVENIKPVILELATVDFDFHSFIVFRDPFQLAYLNGPPRPVSDTPLYISFHNIRI